MSSELLFYNVTAIVRNISSRFLQYRSRRSRRYDVLRRFVRNIVLPACNANPFEVVSLPECADMASFPRVSIIISTFNRAEFLRATLTSLALQRYSNFEVIVVNGPSTDHTLSVLSTWGGRIKIANCSDRNISESRNLGVAMANGDVVAFLDDDAIPEPDWLEEHLSAMKVSRCAAMGGPIREPDGVTFQSRRLVSNSLADVRPTLDRRSDEPSGSDWRLTLTGTNLVVRRDILVAVGGFDANYRYFLDETDLLRRIALQGGRLGFNPSAEVHHYSAHNCVRPDTSPPDYTTILVSLVYFCLRHRHVQTSDDALADRVVRELQKIARRLRGVNRHTSLNPSTARTAWRTALKALRMIGQHDFSSLLPTLSVSLATFQPFSVEGGPKERYAILDDEENADFSLTVKGLAARLAKSGCEVTVIRSPLKSGAVTFDGGIWWHNPRKRRWARFRIGSKWAYLRSELRRLNAHRSFEWIVTPPDPISAAAFCVEPYSKKSSTRTALPGLAAKELNNVILPSKLQNPPFLRQHDLGVPTNIKSTSRSSRDLVQIRDARRRVEADEDAHEENFERGRDHAAATGKLVGQFRQ